MCMAFAATALASSVRPPAVAADTKAEMARYGAVFSRGQSPVDSRWIHGGKHARYMTGTSRGTWWVPPEVHGGYLPRYMAGASRGKSSPLWGGQALLNQGDSPCVIH